MRSEILRVGKCVSVVEPNWLHYLHNAFIHSLPLCSVTDIIYRLDPLWMHFLVPTWLLPYYKHWITFFMFYISYRTHAAEHHWSTILDTTDHNYLIRSNMLSWRSTSASSPVVKWCGTLDNSTVISTNISTSNVRYTTSDTLLTQSCASRKKCLVPGLTAFMYTHFCWEEDSKFTKFREFHEGTLTWNKYHVSKMLGEARAPTYGFKMVCTSAPIKIKPPTTFDDTEIFNVQQYMTLGV